MNQVEDSRPIDAEPQDDGARGGCPVARAKQLLVESAVVTQIFARRSEPEPQAGSIRSSLDWRQYALLMLVGLAALAATLAWVHELRQEERNQIRRTTAMVVTAVKADAAGDLEALYLSQLRPADFRLLEQNPSFENWQAEAAIYLRHHPGFRALVFADTGHHLRWGVTQNGELSRRALDAIETLPLQRALQNAAQQNAAASLSPAVPLPDGVEGRAVVVPLYHAQQRRGFLLGLVPQKEALDELLGDVAILGYSISLYENGKEIYRLPGSISDYEKEWGQDMPLDLPGISWRVRVWPRPTLLAEMRSHLPVLALSMGGALSLLLMLTVYFAQTVRAKNRRLTGEIAQRQRAVRDAEVANERVSGIIGAAMDAIITVDEQQRIVLLNGAAEEVFRCRACDALGKPLEIFLPERFRQAHRGHVAHFGRTGETSRNMYSPANLFGLRANGEEFPLEASISQLSGDDGAKLYTVILRDITKRKLAEEAVLRSEKLASMGRMAATLAHEINNPLTAAINSLFLVQHEPSLSQSARHHVEVTQEQLKRVAEISQLTLGFARQDATLSYTTAEALMQSALGLLTTKIKRKRVTVRQRCCAELQLLVPEGQIRQVVVNLLSNSLDAVSEGGRISVHAGCGHDWRVEGRKGLRVTIADNGTGIKAGDRTRIFEPFFSTKSDTGNGLGLWISKEIVEKHRGSITLRSRSDRQNSGTVISIFIPTPGIRAVKRPDAAQVVTMRRAG